MRYVVIQQVGAVMGTWLVIDSQRGYIVATCQNSYDLTSGITGDGRVAADMIAEVLNANPGV